VKAAITTAHGGRETIRVVEDWPDPVAGAGQVAVEIAACAVNFHDIFTRRGMPGIKLKLPVVVGSDIAGTISAVGSGVEGWTVGDRVLIDPVLREGAFGMIGETVDGGRASHIAVGTAQLVAIPDGVTLEQAAALPLAYGTAYRMMMTQGKVVEGDKVLVLGASGGVGALVDASGDDRYEGGEFAQGIGYFLSMGILRDGGGRDLYYGNRYAQGTAAHQAFGALLEDGGDDIYWSMTAAGQGAAWDMAGAALVDRAGDDRYQADGLSQGAAAQQAIGMLVDLAGRDDYRAGGSSQGAGGENAYHWDTSRTHSLGMLRDDEGPDRFGAGRGPGRREVTGDGSRPTGGSQWGLFLAR